MAFGLDTGPDNVVTIKVIGVGGGGNNVVNRNQGCGFYRGQHGQAGACHFQRDV